MHSTIRTTTGDGMKIAVDLTTCENHGQCTYVAPAVFSLDDQGQLSLRAMAQDEYLSDEISEELRDGVEEAIGMCPVQAIQELQGDRR
jgi:ferredoxin